MYQAQQASTYPFAGSVQQSLTQIQSAFSPARSLRQIIKARSRRAKFFSGSLFGEPAWDMLLELYLAQLEQRRVAVTSLCIASGTPLTTALRHLKKMENEDLIRRNPDPLDSRRFFISLSASGLEAIEAYFDSGSVPL